MFRVIPNVGDEVRLEVRVDGLEKLPDGHPISSLAFYSEPKMICIEGVVTRRKMWHAYDMECWEWFVEVKSYDVHFE